MNTTRIDNDPVVKEIPVFLSKTLADKLYIVQYPAYVTDGYANATILKTSIKPENKKIHMEFAIDTLNENCYDCNMGKQLALIADGKSKKDDEKVFNSELMDKIVLTSERTMSDCSNLAVGVFQDDELHITPLNGMLHMKLQCDYLDENDKRNKDGTKSTIEEGDEEEDNAMPVQVTFAKHQSDNVKRMQEQSFQHYSKKSQEEPWIHTNYVPFYDTQTELTRMEMFCSLTEDESINLNLPKNYLSLLVPKECNSREYDNQVDFHNIATLPLLDQLRIIMKKVRIITFSALREFVSPEHDTITMLKYMQQVAVLVQGNWVVNSELIYPKDSLSVQSNISELMCKARDYILLLFTEHQYLKRNAVLSFIKLASDEINQIFEELGIYEPKKGWRLKLPPNRSFCDRYSEIAQRQEMFWDAKRKHVRETMEAYNQPPQRQRRKSNRESLGSENEERNVGRGRKSLRDSSLSDNDGEPTKHKKSGRSRKVSETTT
ncbi:DNA-directed RNA polymerase III subunit RPC5 [Camponotus floridanus]|uniref:DNA-directed RNA polymerase III subunit RPC5 n=1 Tax=Camponotus floridanus TaxID=104421 RepID=E2A2W1_CAMFO|nr:DNA-directed RNA polymerase III subunit RPC5 [Camponotus floridanus]EFN72235.1 DNA-directed RNA polymerase III subunit RPC5 [Camponotus floridanus]